MRWIVLLFLVLSSCTFKQSVGPAGPKGDQGAKGDTGATGEQGIAGANGDNGSSVTTVVLCSYKRVTIGLCIEGALYTVKGHPMPIGHYRVSKCNIEVKPNCDIIQE